MVLSALNTSICSSSCMCCSMSNTISPFGICEIWRPLDRKLPTSQAPKSKLFAHCCHDSVESLISTSYHIIDIHTEHSMDFSTLSKNKCTWIESTTCESMFNKRCLESVPPFLSRIHQSVHRFSQPQDCLMIKVEHSSHVIWW